MWNQISILFRASSSCLKPNCGFKWIVNPPLETSQSSNHNDSCHKSSPEPFEADLWINSTYLLTDWSLFAALTIKFRDHGICGMWDNRTENTSQISWSKSDAKLSAFTVVFFSLSKNIIIEILDEPFESDEFDDGIGNLTAPERTNTLVQSSSA